MVKFLLILERIIFYIYNPLYWISFQIMNSSNNFSFDEEKQKEKKELKEKYGLGGEDNMNLFDWLFYIFYPIMGIIFLIGFVVAFIYNKILIPLLKKSNLSIEQQLQFEKIKNRWFLK